MTIIDKYSIKYRIESNSRIQNKVIMKPEMKLVILDALVIIMVLLLVLATSVVREQGTV